ncbi:MAG: xanthine dehydrogenase family protein molybdopterin-binding subunit, partial [Rhodospirillales bacterium]
NPDNLANWHEAGDREATEAAFAKAAQVVSLDLVNNRVLPAPMEPRACLGDYEAENRTYRLWTSSQGAHLVRDRIAGKALKVQPEALQVIIPDVGGAFGQKIFPYAEEALVLWASRKIGRPVKWVSTRAENLAHDTHGRDLRHRAELALDADGRILALRVDTVGNLGAYASLYGPMVQSFVHTPMLPGVYAIPVMHVRTRSYYTNTAPIDAYRGAGRPEASYLIERLVDAAARQTGRTPDAFRRLSFIPEAAMPYATCGGRTYDTGAFERVMDVALERADWAGRAERRAAAAAKGLLLGTGFACYIEACGGGGQEAATLTLAPDGRFELLIGTQDSGQGHRTAYAQVVADVLAIDAGLVTVRQGDTALIETGGGTGGSRSLPVGGPATRKAAEALLADLRGKAGALLQVEGETLRYDSGRFHREATGQTLSLAEIAAESGPVTAANLHRPQAATFPNGCHVAELTIDPATGQCCVTRYHVVDDFGRLVNPMLAEGQIIGGIAQGIGQALMEDARYDAETGAFISSGFATYAIPHASDLPRIDIAFENTPCTTNPLGIKGAGEAGTIGACGAIMNAVLDALAPLGIGHVDMPATPETLWRLIRDARNAQGFS